MKSGGEGARTAGAAPSALSGLLTPGAAVSFVVFLGVVSLLADMTYQGGRSIPGPFLAQLAALPLLAVVAAKGNRASV